MSSVFQNAINNYLSPIKELLDDDSVSEIMINGPFEIFAEKKGLVYKTSAAFKSDEALLSGIRAIAQSVGKTIDSENPRLDARLPDGSRIHVVIAPMARSGTTVAIRKFSKASLTFKDLVKFGALTKPVAKFLDIAMYLGRNTLVSGGTGSGKTTILNLLGGRVPKTQRLLVIEDSAELQIEANHVVSFEVRSEDPQKGIKGVGIRDLVHSAMRLRPDRIIVGEIRGNEALDLIQVMNTGHDGSMGTIHANAPQEACVRLETLALMSESPIPAHLMNQMVASALQLIVQCKRYRDGGRRISHVSEVLGVSSKGFYEIRDLFVWKPTGKTQSGKLIGKQFGCGNLPSFWEEVLALGVNFPESAFDDEAEDVVDDVA